MYASLAVLCHLVIDLYPHCNVFNDTVWNEADHNIIMLSFNFQNSFVNMFLHSNKMSINDYNVFVMSLLRKYYFVIEMNLRIFIKRSTGQISNALSIS